MTMENRFRCEFSGCTFENTSERNYWIRLLNNIVFTLNEKSMKSSNFSVRGAVKLSLLSLGIFLACNKDDDSPSPSVASPDPPPDTTRRVPLVKPYSGIWNGTLQAVDMNNASCPFNED